MPLALPDDDRPTATDALKRYLRDELDADVGDLAAGLLLDFVLSEIGPSVYNAALADAQRELAARIADLDLMLGEPEFPTQRR